MQRVVTAWAFFLGQTGTVVQNGVTMCHGQTMTQIFLNIYHRTWMKLESQESDWVLRVIEEPAREGGHQSFMIREICATAHIHQYGSAIGKCWGRHFIDILEPVLGSLHWILCKCDSVFWRRWLPLYYCVLRNIIRAAIPGAPKRQKAWRLAIQIWINIADGDVIAWSQVAFAMEKAAVLDLLAAKWHPRPALSSLVFLVGKSFPRPQAHSIGKVYAGLGLPCSLLTHLGNWRLEADKCNFSISLMLKGYSKDVFFLQEHRRHPKNRVLQNLTTRENAWNCHWTSMVRLRQHPWQAGMQMIQWTLTSMFVSQWLTRLRKQWHTIWSIIGVVWKLSHSHFGIALVKTVKRLIHLYWIAIASKVSAVVLTRDCEAGLADLRIERSLAMQLTTCQHEFAARFELLKDSILMWHNCC